MGLYCYRLQALRRRPGETEVRLPANRGTPKNITETGNSVQRSKIPSRHCAASILLRERDRSSSDSIVLLEQENIDPEVFRRPSEKDNKENSSGAGGIGEGAGEEEWVGRIVERELR